jgi:hypothetical protein
MTNHRLVEEVDEHHGDAMRAVEDTPSPTAHASRRRFVRNLGVGGAVALGAASVPTALLAPSAFAQTTSGAGDVDVPADDLVILQYMVGLELAAEAAYQAALEADVFESADDQMARTFAQHHHDHALALAELTGQSEEDLGAPNAALTDAVTPPIAGASDASGLWQVLFEIEQSMAATYAEALAALQSQAAVAPNASILPVESQHATAIGSRLQLPVEEWMPPFQTTDGAYDPATYAG